ncbi:hypothetical protein LC586_33100 [Nostoc sp. CHAB 5714]|uniref:DZANK-type domain-containing protein n=1 Tax=Nostoc favosum CHAB5714 TaxID=2780399 RepID=A0ABS8IHY2_9NOSO|nr:hypothetical protein [Nostoc favosum CHAB5714]
MCGTALRNSCAKCNEPITSLKFRFCPYCGFPYKASKDSESQSYFVNFSIIYYFKT